MGESSAACGLTAQCHFNAHVAPGLMGNAAKRKPRFFDLIAVELERRGDRNQSKRIRQPVADFQIGVAFGEAFNAGNSWIAVTISSAPVDSSVALCGVSPGRGR